MLGYQVNFKTEADPDHREWHLGRWPNAEDALAFFNDNAAKKDGLGRRPSGDPMTLGNMRARGRRIGADRFVDPT